MFGIRMSREWWTFQLLLMVSPALLLADSSMADPHSMPLMCADPGAPSSETRITLPSGRLELRGACGNVEVFDAEGRCVETLEPAAAAAGLAPGSYRIVLRPGELAQSDACLWFVVPEAIRMGEVSG